MASEEIALVLSHCPENHHSHLLFPDNSTLGFRCNPSPQNHQSHTTNNNNNNNGKTTLELTGFIEYQNRHYQPQSQSTTEFRRSICETGPTYHRGFRNWNVRNAPESSSQTEDGSDRDDDIVNNDMDDGDDISDSIKNSHKRNISGNNIGSIKQVMKEGTGAITMLENDINGVRSSPIVNQNHQQGQLCQYQNAITIADPNCELYYPQLYSSVESPGSGFKDMLSDNGCGFSGRKDSVNSCGSGESLRAILSDPLTGVLMDDAMILPCGHSFGSSGMQHVMRMKACYTCSHPVSESSASPNLALRSAIHAFVREEELQTNPASKRRIRLNQDKSNYGDLLLMDQTRGRGVQFPFRVSEHVIIKGNKRTPPRFVGREAVVTTQCLNGWCVVKTVDNAESVKLQYRSLAKIQHSQLSNLASSKTTTPNWL